MIDSHAHLYFDRFDDDLEAVIERARGAGVEKIINVGIDAATSRSCIDLAGRQEGFFAAAGIHPTSEVDDEDEEIRALRDLIERNRALVVAVGEIGLDYHWKDVPPEVQRPRFARQMQLARELDLPVIIHCREALDEVFKLLEAGPSPPPGVFHCFAGGADDVVRAGALGFHISLAGNVTYPRAVTTQEAARTVEDSRLLLETDSPFLPPQPRRGRRNEPSFLEHTLAFLADLRRVSAEELERTTTRNAENLFGV